jgi:low affinity Fe/Cu permease
MPGKVIRAVNTGLERFSVWTTRWAGSTPAFVLSVFLILGWLVTGPIYNYCDTWQLVANTFTTLVEFVMVFILQRAQNKDTQATHDKLNKILLRLDSRQENDVESKG